LPPLANVKYPEDSRTIHPTVIHTDAKKRGRIITAAVVATVAVMMAAMVAIIAFYNSGGMGEDAMYISLGMISSAMFFVVIIYGVFTVNERNTVRQYEEFLERKKREDDEEGRIQRPTLLHDPGSFILDSLLPESAVIHDLASVAVGAVRLADDLPVSHKVPVDVRPAVLICHVHESELGLLGGLGVHQAHEVGDPVHVGVHAYRGDVHGIGPDACRGLPPHHRKLHHLIGVGWNDAVVLVPEYPTALHYRLPLLFGESRWADKFGDVVDIRIGDRLDGGIFVEQVVGGLPRVVVLSTL